MQDAQWWTAHTKSQILQRDYSRCQQENKQTRKYNNNLSITKERKGEKSFLETGALQLKWVVWSVWDQGGIPTPRRIGWHAGQA